MKKILTGLVVLFLFGQSQLSGQSIINVDPDSVVQGKQYAISITGTATHFTDITVINSVQFRQGTGRINPDSLNIINDTFLTGYFTISFSVSGLWDLRVTTQTDGQMNKTGALTILASPFKPALLSVDPDTAWQGQGLYVTVNATNTHFTTGGTLAVRLSFGMTTRNADSIAVIDDSTLLTYFTIPATFTIRTYNFVVQNTTDGTITLTNGFTVVVSPFAPQIVSIDPDSAYQGDQLSINVYAKNTHFTSGGTLAVRLSAGMTTRNADSITVVDDSTLLTWFTIPFTFTVRTYNFVVGNSTDGTMTLTNGFTVLASPIAPKLLSVDPDSATQGDIVSMYIYGTNTHFLNSSNLTVTLTGGTGNNILPDSGSILNDSLLLMHFSIKYSTAAMYYAARVSNSVDGTLNLTNAFLVLASPNPPVLVKVDPDTVVQGTKAVFTLFAHLTSFTKGAEPGVTLILQVNQIPADSVDVINDTVLKAYYNFSPTVPVGLYNLRISGGYDGTMTLNGAVRILVSPLSPQIIGIKPNKAHQGDTFIMSVFGKNTEFTNGTNQALRLTRGGGQFIDPDSILIVNDSLIIGFFKISPTAPTGFYNVLVSGTIDGNLTLTQAFEVLLPPTAPQIIFVTPARAVPGDSLMIQVACKNTTLTASTNPVVTITRGPQTITGTDLNIMDDTTATVIIKVPQAFPIGLCNVRFTGAPEGTLTLNNGFEITAKPIIPVILALQPDSAYTGQSYTGTLVCSGTQLTRSPVIQIAFIFDSLHILIPDSFRFINDTLMTIFMNVSKTALVEKYDIALFSSRDGNLMLPKGLRIYQNTVIDEVKENEVAVYPNPFNDQIIINHTEGIRSFEIFDIRGKLIMQGNEDESEYTRLDFSGQSSGMYLLRIVTANSMETFRIIKK